MADTMDHNEREELIALLSDESLSDRERLETVWEAASPHASEGFPSPERTRQIRSNLDEALNRPGMYAVPVRRVPVRKIFTRFAMAAAAIVVLVAVGVVLRVRTHVYESPISELRTLELPDGSSVELNNGSRLTFRRSLSGDRFVSLEGEAFFDVTKTDRVFEVVTFNGRIDVLGTRFNIRAWESGVDQATIVMLESGSLRLAHRDHPRAAVVLSPGETRSILSDRAQPSAAETEFSPAATAWRDGDLIFRDTRLEVALEDVERRFSVEIRLLADEFRDRRINVAFRAPGDPEAVVRDLTVAFGLKYRPTSTGFELFPGEE